MKRAEVVSNGLIDSWAVSFNGQIVLSGCTKRASEEYARRLNETARAEGLFNYEAITVRETTRPQRRSRP